MRIAVLVGAVILAIAGCAGGGPAEALWNSLSEALGGDEALCLAWQGAQLQGATEKQEYVDSIAMMHFGAPSNVESEEEFVAFAVEVEETFRRHCE